MLCEAAVLEKALLQMEICCTMLQLTGHTSALWHVSDRLR